MGGPVSRRLDFTAQSGGRSRGDADPVYLVHLLNLLPKVSVLRGSPVNRADEEIAALRVQ